MKFFRLPTPMELGHPSNALTSREWTPDETSYSWEDYDAEVSKKYPVRWAIRQFGRAIRRTWYRIDMAWFGLVSRFWTRHHILDLRKCKDTEYTGGYMDPCDSIPIAMFGILVHHVEECGVLQKVAELESHLRETPGNPGRLHGYRREKDALSEFGQRKRSCYPV